MIRIKREPETAPAWLVNSEATERPVVAALPGASGPLVTQYVAGRARDAAGKPLMVHQPQALVDGDAITGYGKVRPNLWKMQHYKCCYCESTPEEKHHHVEHFRPKSCYWWLAWTWSNLMFCCNICNEHKLDYFPLSTAECLQPKDPPPGTEKCLLIDPSDSTAPDPLEHIEFVSLGKYRWVPVPRNGSRLGQEVIAAVKLDRSTLLDRYRQHAEKFEDAVARIWAQIAKQDPNELRDVWEDICDRWLKAEMPYAALSRDILTHHFAKQIEDFRLDVSVRYPVVPPAT